MGQRVCTRPPDRFPTCYTLQADIRWAHEDVNLDATGANWVNVGTVTFAEVVAAIGALNTLAP